MKKITLPLTRETARTLRSGDKCLLSGTLYTARDAAHKRLCEALQKGEPLPVDLKDITIYFAGPAPAAPGQTHAATVNAPVTEDSSKSGAKA